MPLMFLGPTASCSTETVFSSASTIPYVDEHYVIFASRSTTSAITLYSDSEEETSQSDLFTHFVPRSTSIEISSNIHEIHSINVAPPLINAETPINADTHFIPSIPARVEEDPQEAGFTLPLQKPVNHK